MFTDHYQTLEIPPFSSKEAVKEAYKKQAHKHHPDKGGTAEQFRRVKEARDFLMSNQKSAYDQEYLINNSYPDYWIYSRGRKVPVVVVDAKKTGKGTSSAPLMQGTYLEKMIKGTKFIIPAKED